MSTVKKIKHGSVQGLTQPFSSKSVPDVSTAPDYVRRERRSGLAILRHENKSVCSLDLKRVVWKCADWEDKIFMAVQSGKPVRNQTVPLLR